MLQILLLLLSPVFITAHDKNFCNHETGNYNIWNPDGSYCHLGDSYACYEGEIRNYTQCKYGCEMGRCLLSDSIWVVVIPVIVIIGLCITAVVVCCISEDYDDTIRRTYCVRCCKPKININNYVI